MTGPYRDPAPDRPIVQPGSDRGYVVAGELCLATVFTGLGLGLWWFVGAILHADLLTIVRAIP